MIRILSKGTLASIKTSQNHVSTQIRFGGGIKQCDFFAGVVEIQTKWDDTQLTAELISSESIFVESFTLSFKYKSPKTSSDTSIWSESFSDDVLSERVNGIPGVETSRRNRHGAWAMWIGEAPDAEGMLLSQDSPAYNHPLSFECKPVRHRINVTWSINSQLSRKQKILLSRVVVSQGRRIQTVDYWQKQWMMTRGEKKNNVRLTKGWIGGSSISSPDDILESLKFLKKEKIKLDWFAIDSGFAGNSDDWLKPTDQYQKKMNTTARYISDAQLVPGIRFSPFLVSRNSKIAEEHKGWLVHTEKGSPVIKKNCMGNKACCILDATNPKVKDHILNTLTVMKNQWGFHAFVLDNITDLAIPGKRTNNTLSPGRLISGIVKLIRKTVGNNVLLVGMKSPLLSATGMWDIQTIANEIKLSLPEKALINIASSMIHRARWNKGAWLNASGPISIELFGSTDRCSINMLRDAIPLSAGSVLLSGDPRALDKSASSNIKSFMTMFEECQNGNIMIGNQSGGGRKKVLVVRNNRGWLALFNFSPDRTTVCLSRNTLRKELGIISPLSAEDRTLLDSQEIHLALPPWGHRLLKG